VTIGDHCYIGSEARMAPGAAVPDCCIVGMGAVVVRPFAETYSLLAGVPAVRRRALGPDDYETIFGPTRRDVPDDGYRPPPRPEPPAPEPDRPAPDGCP
jgi:carbonic anhydrase/acetyltransferase-like protein (isoleucine patch superfamily)